MAPGQHSPGKRHARSREYRSAASAAAAPRPRCPPAYPSTGPPALALAARAPPAQLCSSSVLPVSPPASADLVHKGRGTAVCVKGMSMRLTHSSEIPQWSVRRLHDVESPSAQNIGFYYQQNVHRHAMHASSCAARGGVGGPAPAHCLDDLESAHSHCGSVTGFGAHLKRHL